MSHVLVTGGAGFIGSHVVDALLARGDDVTVIDNFEPDYPRAIKERYIAAHRRHPNWRFFKWDLRRPIPPVEYDAIIHLAGKAGVLPSITDPLGTYAVNVTGTLHVLELARQTCTPKMVFASSSSVYGGTTKFPSEETDPLTPISPYASSKLAGEQLCQLYAHLHGIRTVALRFFTVYGPRQRPDLAIHKFARAMLDKQPVTLYGDGSSQRDYTYIHDIVAGILRALEYDRTPFEIVNLGSGAPITLRAMVETVASALGIRPRIEELPVQAGDPPTTWADITKAQQLLAWAPTLTFEQGTARFIEWLQQDEARHAA